MKMEDLIMAPLTVKPADEKRVKAMGFLSNKGTDNFNGRVITVNGKITAAQMRCISEAAEKFGNGEVEFTTRMTVEVAGIPYDKIEEFQAYIAKEGLVTGGTGAKVRPIVSCKGTTCQYGRLDSFALSREIHERFYEGYREVSLPHKCKIAVGGCPNNCVKPDLNDIGIVGQLIPNPEFASCKGCKKCAIEKVCPTHAAKVVDGVLTIDEKVCSHCGRCVTKCPFGTTENGTYGYKIYVGGRWGKKVSHGIPLSKIFTDKEEALKVVEKAILLFREQGYVGERFAVTIERLGFEKVEAELLSDDILARKDAILAAELKKAE
jgi:dissimilatory sulfite reductase (desulfoviridin) alpha/beta subunit